MQNTNSAYKKQVKRPSSSYTNVLGLQYKYDITLCIKQPYNDCQRNYPGVFRHALIYFKINSSVKTNSIAISAYLCVNSKTHLI